MITENPQELEDLELEESIDEEEVSIAYDIVPYPSDLTLSVLSEMWKNGDILIPEFQRNFVWSIKQASLLIESFLLGLPVPQIFFYIDEENKNLVIDGQQRILSIVYFLEGYFGNESIQGKRQVFRLTGLGEINPFHKKRFKDLEETHQRKLKSAVLRAINIKQLSPKGENTSIYHIFERLNTGGTPLKPQEIRNCVFRGGLVGILRELNEDKNWRRILGRKTFDKHQKDVELILRIFALAEYWTSYKKPLKEFLNKAMVENQKGTSKRIKKFKERFPRVAKAIIEELGEKPFHLRGPLNTSALDSVFCMIFENIEKLPANLSKKYKNLLNDKQFQEVSQVGTSDETILNKRFDLAKKHLFGG